jgi:VHL beta domain
MFTVTVAGDRLPVTTRQPYLAETVRMVGQRQVQVLVGKTPDTPAGNSTAPVSAGKIASGSSTTSAGPRCGNSTEPVSVAFTNSTSQPVEIFWVDFSGKEKGYGALAPGATVMQPTYVSQVWRFRQEAQVVGEYTVPNANPGQRYVIAPVNPCPDGLTPRQAVPGDNFCVTTLVRDQVLADNAQASSRRAGSGAYGPDTCKQGFVWREATPTDHVCVTPDVRTQAASPASRR